MAKKTKYGETRTVKTGKIGDKEYKVIRDKEAHGGKSTFSEMKARGGKKKVTQIKSSFGGKMTGKVRTAERTGVTPGGRTYRGSRQKMDGRLMNSDVMVSDGKKSFHADYKTPGSQKLERKEGPMPKVKAVRKGPKTPAKKRSPKEKM